MKAQARASTDHGRSRALAAAPDERKSQEGVPGTTGICVGFWRNEQLTGPCPKRIRRGDTPETTRKQAPAHLVRVWAQFQQRGRRRSGRVPRSANRGSMPGCTLPLGIGCHATALRHGVVADVSSPRRQATIPIRKPVPTLARILDFIIAGHVVAAADLLMQRFRLVEMAALEGGEWSIARHWEVVVSAERELQKIRGKLVGTSTSGDPTSPSGRPGNGSRRSTTNRMWPRRNSARKSRATKGAETSERKTRTRARAVESPTRDWIHSGRAASPNSNCVKNPMTNYLRDRCACGDLSAPTITPKVGAIRVEVTAPTLQRTRKPSASIASDGGRLLGNGRAWRRITSSTVAAPAIVRPICLATSMPCWTRSRDSFTTELHSCAFRSSMGFHWLKLGRISARTSDCFHVDNARTTAPSGRHGAACCLFRSLLPRQAIPRPQKRLLSQPRFQNLLCRLVAYESTTACGCT